MPKKVVFKNLIEKGDPILLEFLSPTSLFRKIDGDPGAVFLKLYDIDKSEAYWRNCIEIGSGEGRWIDYDVRVQQLEIVDVE